MSMLSNVLYLFPMFNYVVCVCGSQGSLQAQGSTHTDGGNHDNNINSTAGKRAKMREGTVLEVTALVGDFAVRDELLRDIHSGAEIFAGHAVSYIARDKDIKRKLYE